MGEDEYNNTKYKNLKRSRVRMTQTCQDPDFDLA